MHTTELRRTGTGTFLRVTYGLHRIGTQDPYFSITADEYPSDEPDDEDLLSCGQMHDEVRSTFPELAHLIRWHLSSATGPMHYVANGMFWIDAYHGVAPHQHIEDCERAPSALTSTVVLGALQDDLTVDALLALSREDAQAYLEGRLPALKAAFAAAMASL